MKLAFICTEKHPVPAIKGGAIQILIDGVSPIFSEKHDLFIFSVSDPSLPKQETRNGIRYIRVPKRYYPTGVAKQLAKHDFDVIHVFNRPKFVSTFKAASPKSKFVLSLHNEMFAPEKISHSQGKKTIHQAEKIMTVSNYIGRTITRRFPFAKSKVKTVYSGCDLNIYVPIWSTHGQSIRSELRRKYGVEGKKVILFVGRLSDKKGPHLLIQSMKQVLAKHKDAVLMLVGGKGFSNNSIDDYIRHLLRLAKPFGNKVIFTKYIPSEEISKIFLAGDIFVCSSQWQEPLARVHYEAMGAGLPVITTDRGGNSEIVKHMQNGIVLKKCATPQPFSEAINYLLSNPTKASQLARNGRKLIEGNFSFEHVAGRLEDVYQEAFMAKPSITTGVDSHVQARFRGSNRSTKRTHRRSG